MVILHGVNVVYKHAPYIAYPDPGTVELRCDGRGEMQQLGFNVVRLGIEWQALEPGRVVPTNPRSARPGPRATRTN